MFKCNRRRRKLFVIFVLDVASLRFSLLTSLIELWEERRTIPVFVVKGIACASLVPVNDRVVLYAAREFAASCILRMRHLIPPQSISIPADAPPKLTAAFLVLQTHHKLVQGQNQASSFVFCCR